MPDYVEIRKYSGISTFVSKEDRPIEVLQEARNLRFSHKIGRLVKRGGYENILTSGLTALKNMIEFKNKNSERLLMIMDGNTLEESVYSSGYGAIGAIANDERTAGSTIDGTNFFPIIINKELRSGAGISADTQLPVWYGYIAERDRFNAAETITAGRYLDEQYYIPSKIYSSFITPAPSNIAGEISGSGLDPNQYALYIVPIYDDYQKGFPILIGKWKVFNAGTAISLNFRILSADAINLKRLTAFDVFIAPFLATHFENLDATPAYYLERIHLNDDSDYFLEISGDVGVTTANKIVIDNMSEWLLFNPTGTWIHDTSNSEYYLITGYTRDSPGAGQVTLTVTPNAPADGTATLRFFSRWYEDGLFYKYQTFYDDYYKKLSSEMYDYLGIPKGDIGISDFRYLYSANNGIVSIYAGFPDDKNFSYFSVDGSPDVVPAQNIFRHKADVRGVVSIGKDFLVFTDIGVERITILANGVVDQNDEYLDAVLVHHKAIAKISDNEIAFMSYKGAYIISDRRVIFVGKHLKDWFIGADALLTQSQKEACVAHFHDESNEVWFSFPTYTTSPYTAGITHVFDIEAYRGEDLSAWWFLQSDVALLAFTKNIDQHTLGGGATKIVDMDAYGADETVATAHKLKLLQGAIPNRLVRWGWLHLDRYSSSDETITVNLYFEGSGTPVVLTLNSDYRGLIAYVKKTLEIEITTPASTKDIEFLGTVLEFQPKQVA